MNKASLTLFFLLGLFNLNAQMYFPPVDSDNWETMSPSALNWSADSIESFLHFLESNNTKAFILLKDGKIVLEEYFGGHSQTSLWYWASAGKSLTAFLVGISQQENHLSLNDSVSHYLGKGWTNCTPSQEGQINIRHLLTMTSGLNDDVEDPYCTLDSCLNFIADAGTRWAYHNAPYTMLDPILESATGIPINGYVSQKLKNTTGISGWFIKQGYNNVFFSTARSMARFGLLVLNHGNWNNLPVLADTAYFNQMVSTSQSFNRSYGYLWWLNGKDSYMVPGLQWIIPGMFNRDAPSGMFAAMGKNGQVINIVPEENLVWIRMGNAPDDLAVPYLLNNQIWQYLNRLQNKVSAVQGMTESNEINVFPNPATSELTISIPQNFNSKELIVSVYNLQGRLLMQFSPNASQFHISLADFPKGIYLLMAKSQGKTTVKKINLY